ncbi:hypothetical protein LV475_04940 [Guyparkeria hydrothermalis]|uniref:hypothetical protein n=1 Tax=Guyparkeria TaxID=2035712 RepID=UPI0010AB9FAC|nr:MULTISPECIES: hypothetical protein [Guyparkeria]MCL7750939.1 hypothetical protein [Guyparkeria hydrothermalis]TKA88688.1 hypothetical protein FAZ79_09225 [Guyparkeria sp. SB14A]
MPDLHRLSLTELRRLIEVARAELDSREREPVDEQTVLKSLELDLKRHHRRKDEDRFNPFA